MLKHRGFPGRLPSTDFQFTVRRANKKGATKLVARERYRLGLSDFLTVVDAQRSLNATRQTAEAARNDVARRAVQLYRALGGEPAVITAPRP